MRTYILVITIFIFSVLSQVFALEISKDIEKDVQYSETNGNALFSVSSAKPKGEGKTSAIVLNAINQIKNESCFCEYEYISYIVQSDNKQTVYLMANPSSDDTIIYGRHFKIESNKVLASTKSCLTASKPKPTEKVVAAVTTHLLSDVPTDFHVFLSLKHNIPIYVGTAIGVWKVENGKISFIKANE